MSGIIQYSDLVSNDGAFEEAKKEVKEFSDFVTKEAKRLKGQLSITTEKDSQLLAKYSQEIGALKKQNDKLIQSNKNLEKAKKRNQDLTNKQIKDIEAERRERNENRKVIRQQIRLQQAEEGSIEQLRAKLAIVTREWANLTEAERKNGDRGKRLIRVKKELTEELKKEEKATGDTRRNVGNYEEAIKKVLTELRKEEKELKATNLELKKQQSLVKKNTAEWLQYEKEIQKVEKRQGEVNAELGQTGRQSIGDRLKGAGSQFDASSLGGSGQFGGVTGQVSGALSKIGPLGAAAAGVVGAIGGITAAVVSTEKEFTKLRGTISKTLGASGTELDDFTVKIRAVSQTFGDDEQQIIEATNALVKEFGLNAEEAGEFLESGYLSAANANGEFIDSVREYSTQAKAAGLSQQEFLSILDKSGEAGIYSDKGIDAVKEFGLRIREQTATTGDALRNAFGDEFTDQLFDQINSGAISTAQALQQVSTKLNDTSVPANKLQTVIADVFGGPGEDAGLKFLQTLNDIDSSYGEIVNTADPFVQQQKETLRLQEELAASQNKVAEEAFGAGATFEQLILKLKIFLFDTLGGIVNFFKGIKEGINDIVDGVGGFFNDVGNFFTGATKAQKLFTDAEKEAIRIRQKSEKATKAVIEGSKDEILTVARKIDALKDSNLTEEQRLELISELQSEYPDLLQNIDLENASIEELTNIRKALNEEIANEAVERAKAAKVAALYDKVVQAQINQSELAREGFKENSAIFQLNQSLIDDAKQDLEDLPQVFQNVKSEVKEFANSIKTTGLDLIQKEAESLSLSISKVSGDIQRLENAVKNSTGERKKQAENELLIAKANLEGLRESYKATKLQEEQLLELGDIKEKQAKKDEEIIAKGAKGASARTARTKEQIDLNEILLKQRAKLADTEEAQEKQLANIDFDEQRKRFDELLKTESDPKRINQLVEITGLIEEERQEKINEITEKYRKQRFSSELDALKKENEIKAQQLEQSLLKSNVTDDVAERERENQRIIALEAERDLLQKQGADLNEILAIENEIDNIIKSQGERRQSQQLALDQTVLEGELESYERLISDAEQNVSKESIKVLQGYYKERFNLLTKQINLEYDAQIKSVEDGSLEQQRLIIERDQKLAALKRDFDANIESSNERLANSTKETYRTILSEVQSFINKIIDKIAELASLEVEKQEERLDKQNDLVDKQRERAEKGLSNTLAFEQKELAKREKELIDAQKRLERVEKIKALYASYQNYSSNGEVNALQKTLRDFAALEALTAGFAEGGYTGDGGKYDPAGVVHKGEWVVNKGLTKSLGLDKARTDGDFMRIMGRHMEGNAIKDNLLSDKMVPISQRKKEADIQGLKTEIIGIKNAIENRPVKDFDFQGIVDGMIQWTESEKRKGRESRTVFRKRK